MNKDLIRSDVTFTVTCDWGAAYDTLLAIEGASERRYPKEVRHTDPGMQERYNAMAPIVRALRLVVDLNDGTGV